jgi:hypothetical protein
MKHQPNTVRIMGTGDEPVGTGFLVTPSHILTCSHVAAMAQGDPSGVDVDLGKPVLFDLPLLAPLPGKPELHAYPVLAGPVAAKPTVDTITDVCVLRIATPGQMPPDASPAALSQLDEPFGREAAAFGFSRPDGDTVLLTLRAANASGAVQAEQRRDYLEVMQRFSGAAVRVQEGSDWHVVGMLARRDIGEGPRTAFMTPTAQLVRVLEEAGASPMVEAPLSAISDSEPPDERKLWTETVRLLSECLSGDAATNSNLCRNAFRGFKDSPESRLRVDGAPDQLAPSWASTLWEAKCIQGRNPLSLLLEEGFKGKREPKVTEVRDFQTLIRTLDSFC